MLGPLRAPRKRIAVIGSINPNGSQTITPVAMSEGGRSFDREHRRTIKALSVQLKNSEKERVGLVEALAIANRQTVKLKEMSGAEPQILVEPILVIREKPPEDFRAGELIRGLWTKAANKVMGVFG